MLQTILLAVMIVISVALAAVVLLQRSEGGALGMGGGPSGFMTARGAGNLLTKTTWGLATAFFICAIGLTIAGNFERSSGSVVDSEAVRELTIDPTQSQQQQPAQPLPGAAPSAAPTEPTLDDLLANSNSSSPAPAN